MNSKNDKCKYYKKTCFSFYKYLYQSTQDKKKNRNCYGKLICDTIKIIFNLKLYWWKQNKNFYGVNKKKFFLIFNFL